MSGVRTLVDFLRHGEPLGGRKYRGRIDDPLSDKGWLQMRDAVHRHRHWEHVVTSPLLRCKAFAEWLGAHRGLPMSQDERLVEVGFGVWEGRTAAEIKAENADLVFNFKRDPVTHRPDGAEDLRAFQQRVNAAFDDIVSQHGGRHVLVVAHAGVIRMVMTRVLGMPVEHAYRVQVGAAALARFQVEERAGQRLEQLLFLNPGN
jgi:alpha-ribazole phosphatase/probable phosphoglycerate mutase